MSLDVSKLDKVKPLAGGGIQAQCPACAEGGNDRTGEHLRIFPDGRFGCAVNARDRQHRKRIFALVGSKDAGAAVIRTPRTTPTSQQQPVRNILAELDERDFQPKTEPPKTEADSSRTLRTGVNKLCVQEKENLSSSVPEGDGTGSGNTKDYADPVRPVRADELPWVQIARDILAGKRKGDDRNTIESISIGLGSVDHPWCVEALKMLSQEWVIVPYCRLKKPDRPKRGKVRSGWEPSVE